MKLKKLPQNSIVILDRSYYTFLAFEYASKNLKRFERYCKLFPTLESVAKPDLVIFVDIEHNERLKRLHCRGDVETKDTSIMFQKDFNERLKKFFQIYYIGRKTILDLSSKRVEDSYREVLKCVRIFEKYLTKNQEKLRQESIHK